MESLKKLKESFVTGHEGTSSLEVMLVCATVPIGLWCGSVIMQQSWFDHRQHNTVTISRHFILEATVVWIPMILCQSVFLYPWGVAYVVVEIFVAILFEVSQNQPPRERQPQQGRLQEQDGERRELREQNNSCHVVEGDNKKSGKMATTTREEEKSGYITIYRSYMIYLTMIAILAVDFHSFPRRFAKTETHGYGLMDLGASSFVISAGLVSSRATQCRGGTGPGPGGRRRRVPLRRVVPLWAIGFLRLVTHKGIEYQEHASEYGIHWNFFFTLAVLQTIVPFIPGSPTWLVPTILMTIYQCILSLNGAQEWIEEGRRVCDSTTSSSSSLLPQGLHLVCHGFAANREGILGCIGYLSLYMFSEWIGFRTLWSPTSTYEQSSQWLWGVWAILVCFWRLLVVIIGVKVSRRSTNLSFCAWSLVVNLLLLQLIRSIHQRYGMVSMVTRTLNRHGLICFVVANLLTGVVNLSINTLQVKHATAIAILISYMTSIGLLATMLDAATDHILTRRGKGAILFKVD